MLSPSQFCPPGRKRLGTEIGHPAEFGQALLEQLEPLALHVRAGVGRHSRDVSAGPRQIDYKPLFNWGAAERDDRNRRCDSLGQSCNLKTRNNYYIYLEA